MKYIIIFLILLSPLFGFSQSLNSLKGKPIPPTVEDIELKLTRFEKQHSIGVKLLLLSSAMVGICYSVNQLEMGTATNIVMITSGVVALSGSIVILDAPARLKRKFY